jgi:methoxymalonate biosynthesis acyl carrier protein
MDGTPTELADHAMERAVLDFLESRVKTTLRADEDLFASGLVSSLFAMELVAFLERTYAIAIEGEDLNPGHFQTVRHIVALVCRLRDSHTERNGA